MSSLCRSRAFAGRWGGYTDLTSSTQIVPFPLRLWRNNQLGSPQSSTSRFPLRLLHQQTQFRPNSSSSRPQTDPELAHEFRFFRIYKTGRIEKTHPPITTTPPSGDPRTGLRCKDVVIESHVKARIYLPRVLDPTRKLPLLLYAHGGGFCFESAFSPSFHALLSTVSAKSGAVAVSVEYGLFPDRPIPVCYDDFGSALRWVSSHSGGDGPDAWLNDHADLDRVFLAGDSAGANIAHNVSARFGSGGLGWLGGLRIGGLVLVHPYFGGTDDDQMWLYMCPGNDGLDDPRLKPGAEDLRMIPCGKVLVFLAGRDHLNGVGRRYCEDLRKSGWEGTVEIVEHREVEHCFHVHDLTCDKAVDLVDRFVSFIKEN